MKPRKPIKRKTPLKRSWIKRKPPDPEKAKARRKQKLKDGKANDFSVYWRDKADKLWSKIVRIRALGRCQYKGNRCDLGHMDSHHIIPRGIFQFRTDLDNGMAIQKHYHTFDKSAPHGSQSWAWFEWLQKNHPEKYQMWLEHKNDNPTRRIDWHAEYLRLKEIYDKMFDQQGGE